MFSLTQNVIALSAPYGGGWLTVVGYFAYLIYFGFVVLRLFIGANNGKSFSIVRQVLMFSALFAVVLVLFFVDPSNTHKSVGAIIVFFLIWLGSIVFIGVVLDRLQKQALRNR